MVTVVCVLKSGGIYDKTWVAKLQRGVAANLSREHRFVCITDMPVDCNSIPLKHGWSGWWSKIEMFRPGIFQGTVLYFDLDTVITGPLDEIAAYPHKFTMVHEYNRPKFFCSTAMAWSGDYSEIYTLFREDPDGIMGMYRRTKDGRIGDQAYIEDTVQHVMGREVVSFRDAMGKNVIASYKVDLARGEPKEDTAAVSFHGRPKPQDIKSGWVAELWQ